MKTPMQELIDLMIYKRKLLIDVNTNFSRPSEYSAVRIEMLTYTIEWAESMLEKEKEVIKDAWMDDRFPLDKDWVKQCAEQYYNETYGGNK